MSCAAAMSTDVIDRLRTVVDEACGLQPADASPEDLLTLLERKLFELRCASTGIASAPGVSPGLPIHDGKTEPNDISGLGKEAAAVWDATTKRRVERCSCAESIHLRAALELIRLRSVKFVTGMQGKDEAGAEEAFAVYKLAAAALALEPLP